MNKILEWILVLTVLGAIMVMFLLTGIILAPLVITGACIYVWAWLWSKGSSLFSRSETTRERERSKDG